MLCYVIDTAFIFQMPLQRQSSSTGAARVRVSTPTDLRKKGGDEAVWLCRRPRLPLPKKVRYKGAYRRTYADVVIQNDGLGIGITKEESQREGHESAVARAGGKLKVEGMNMGLIGRGEI